ncbi:MAG: cytochrome c [Bacteroidia bacterium]
MSLKNQIESKPNGIAKSILKGSFFILLFLAAFSCTNNNEEDLNPDDDCPTENEAYDGDISQILNTSCATTGCHAAGGGLPSLADYASANSLKERIMVRAITEKTMPPAGPLSDCDIKKLKAWIDAGAPKN